MLLQLRLLLIYQRVLIGMIESIKDPVSGELMEMAFSEVVLGKYDVQYYYSENSGLLKTQTPFWLNEAYEEAISDKDIGLVRRNIRNANILELIISCLSIDKNKFLDLAGGYGLLTRLMRDKGYDCYTTDKYCQNIFAKTFEPTEDFKVDVLFAFEVLEHIDEPLNFLSEMFDKYGTRTIVFSTLTFEKNIPSKDWWYYAFDTGQHITFYQPRTLALMAERLGCNYYMLDSEFHVFTDKKLSFLSSLVITNKYFRKLYSVYLRIKRKLI